MTEPSALPLDSLRRLARGLLYDRDGAEDVVQEAWLAALRQRPPAAELAGWLTRAVRHRALDALRGNARRAERERRAARAEAVPSALELSAKLELLHALLDAVAALEEPHRTAIGLRFFDDLPPRAIAKRLGLPVNTVRTHVRRGLAELRRRLAERPGREGFLAGLAPLAGKMPWNVALGVAPSAGIGGGLGMLAGKKLVVAGAL